MSRQYIFKLTPNKKNVFINTSVLEEGKYSDVEYPIQYKNNSSLGYTLDRDTYKFVDTSIFDDLKSKIYPVSMDISINIPDIPFYAQNMCISNYSIILENNTVYNGNVLSIHNKVDNDDKNEDSVCYPEYNIDITVNWSDKLPNDISTAGIIRYTIYVYPLETSDNKEFSDISTFLDLYKQEYTIGNTSYGYAYEYIDNDSKPKYEKNGKPITAETNDPSIICKFRDSLYEGRRAVAKLKINAVFTDNHTGRTVNATAETIIYQSPYLG